MIPPGTITSTVYKIDAAKPRRANTTTVARYIASQPMDAYAGKRTRANPLARRLETRTPLRTTRCRRRILNRTWALDKLQQAQAHYENRDYIECDESDIKSDLARILVGSDFWSFMHDTQFRLHRKQKR